MQKQCEHCKLEFSAKRSKRLFCSHDCHRKHMRLNGLVGKTLGQVKDLSKKQNAYITIRNHARNVMEASGHIRICSKCGYDKHVEVAHKIAISSFSDLIKIGEVNSLSNLIYLCPNCHWEFDNPD